MSSLSKSFRLSSTLRIEEEATMVFTKNQGIVSILESSNKSSSSLRRTLSADMSSTKWLTQHEFCPMKKIASSEEFSICSITDSSSSDDDEDDDVETEPRSQFDIWSSIIQQKSQEITDNKSLPPSPYIHPLVKRSASSLNQKSLQICTESLGSETGSDGLFSSYPSSVSGDVTDDDDKEMEQDRALEQSFEEGFVPKYNYVAKKSPQRQRSFPPPMPSRRMQWRRDNGRLVLEAVSVPCTNNFLSQRRDGRLVLTFANGIEQEEDEEEEEKKEVDELELEEEFKSFDDEDKESDEEEVGAAFVMELEAPRVSSTTSRVINVHRLTPMGLANRNPITTWPNKFNKVVKFDEDEEDIKPAIVAKSLPPMAQLIPKPPVGTGTVAAAGGGGGGGGGASFNAYEYYWRPNPMTITQSKSNNEKNTQEEKQQLLLLRGNKGENSVPLVKSCKEPRRSLLFWEPYCIATS